MFSKIFINQGFKSYTSFDFIYTIRVIDLKLINCDGIYPLKIDKSHLQPLKRSYYNIKAS